MKSIKSIPALSLTILWMMLIATYQSCGPAVLSSTNAASKISTAQRSTVGNRIDTAKLLNSPSEDPSNVLYPPQNVLRKSYYSEGSPIVENVVLLENDFDLIEWIHADTGLVISNEASFQARQFTHALSGKVFIVGYRGSTLYILGAIELVSRLTLPISASTSGAVTITQSSAVIGTTVETYLAEVNAQDVDINDIHFTNLLTSETVENRRALVVQKTPLETIQIDIEVSDRHGGKFLGTVIIPAKAIAVPASIAASSMSTQSSGQKENDVWKLTSAGLVSDKFSFPTTGTYTIRVGAFGSVAAGVWPNMEIRVDKSIVFRRTIQSSSLSSYNLDLNVAAGIHDIEIAFTNDYASATEDRNLYIGNVSIEPQPRAATGGIANFQVASDAINIYASFDYPGTVTYPRLFLDTDLNPFTGYANSGLGVDYMVENGVFYKYSGTFNNWTWTKIGSSGIVNVAPTVRWTLPRSSFGPVTAIHFLASINTTGFSTIVPHTLSTVAAPQ